VVFDNGEKLGKAVPNR
jgi:hypothetical protein